MERCNCSIELVKMNEFVKENLGCLFPTIYGNKVVAARFIECARTIYIFNVQGAIVRVHRQSLLKGCGEPENSTGLTIAIFHLKIFNLAYHVAVFTSRNSYVFSYARIARAIVRIFSSVRLSCSSAFSKASRCCRTAARCFFRSSCSPSMMFSRCCFISSRLQLPASTAASSRPCAE